eukprot:m.104381 g.104381  ORF g.104381 m.104381 type:complete len:65 (-) comp51593_c0_seq3:858-1052(-)
MCCAVHSNHELRMQRTTIMTLASAFEVVLCNPSRIIAYQISAPNQASSSAKRKTNIKAIQAPTE